MMKINIKKKEYDFPLFKYTKFNLTEEFVLQEKEFFEKLESEVINGKETAQLTDYLRKALPKDSTLKGAYIYIWDIAKELPKQWTRVKKAQIRKNETLAKKLIKKMEKTK